MFGILLIIRTDVPFRRGGVRLVIHHSEDSSNKLSEVEVIKLRLINNICDIVDEDVLRTMFYITKEHLKRQKEKATD